MEKKIRLKDRIRKHFEEKDWDYWFEWGKKKEKWGAKYESVASLAKILNCPYTSLYIPLKELGKEDGFSFHTRPSLIHYEAKL